MLLYFVIFFGTKRFHPIAILECKQLSLEKCEEIFFLILCHIFLLNLPSYQETIRCLFNIPREVQLGGEKRKKKFYFCVICFLFYVHIVKASLFSVVVQRDVKEEEQGEEKCDMMVKYELYAVPREHTRTFSIGKPTYLIYWNGLESLQWYYAFTFSLGLSLAD